MLQILIPTDLQAEAEPGIRFALQLSLVVKAKLRFVYVAYIPRPIGWTDKAYDNFSRTEKSRHLQKLEKMIEAIYRRLKIKPEHYVCQVLDGVSAEHSILDYCEQHGDIDLICMATRGASGFHAIWGTHAGNILSQSRIPVIVVPANYRRTPIKTILYGSDLQTYDTEISRLAPFIRKLGAKFILLHMVQPDEPLPNRHLFEQVLRQELGDAVEVKFPEMHPVRSIAANLREQIKLNRPSLVVLFTDQGRGSVEKLIFPSQAEKLAFETPAPLLVYAK